MLQGTNSVVGMPALRRIALIVVAGSLFSGIGFGDQVELGPPLMADNPQGGDKFGTSLSIDETYAVVGVPNRVFDNKRKGSAIVFELLPQGWDIAAELVPTFPAGVHTEHDGFGYSVALKGDWAMAGAPRDNTHWASAKCGAAFVFRREDSYWNQPEYWFPPTFETHQDDSRTYEPEKDDGFGTAVAMTELIAVVGSPYDWFGGNYRGPAGGDFEYDRYGSAYVYAYDPDDGYWRLLDKIYNPDPTKNAAFGYAVAVHGRTIVIGAPKNKDGLHGPGSAYVFQLDEEFTELQHIATFDGPVDNMEFGAAVSVFVDAANGMTVVVGAPGDDFESIDPPSTLFDAGAAYVLHHQPNVGWVSRTLRASEPGEGFLFGSNVSIHGDTVLIGEKKWDIGANSDIGSAYVFKRAGLLWTEWKQLIDSGLAGRSFLGHSVSAGANAAFIGAPSAGGFSPQEGNAYSFIHQSAECTIEGEVLLYPDRASRSGARVEVRTSHPGNQLVVDTVVNSDGYYCVFFDPAGFPDESFQILVEMDQYLDSE